MNTKSLFGQRCNHQLRRSQSQSVRDISQSVHELSGTHPVVGDRSHTQVFERERQFDGTTTRNKSKYGVRTSSVVNFGRGRRRRAIIVMMMGVAKINFAILRATSEEIWKNMMERILAGAIVQYDELVIYSSSRR